MRLARSLAAALVGLCLSTVAVCPATAEPASWTVKDGDTTIFLFGTIHVLRPDVRWRTDKLDRAFGACRDLNLELIDTEDTKATAALVLKYGMDLAHPLSTRLDAKDRARLAAAAGDLSLSADRMDLMRPWLAGVTLSVAPVLHAGYDPASGVEEILKAEARARGEPVKGLETSESQIRILASLPEDEQLTFLHEALEDYDKAPTELDQLVKAWADGRVDDIDRLMNADLRRQGPALYKLLLVQRNEGFARQIKAMLAEPGAHCVAVGAAHYAGPDGIPSKLKAIGVKAVRN